MSGRARIAPTLRLILPCSSLPGWGNETLADAKRELRALLAVARAAARLHGSSLQPRWLALQDGTALCRALARLERASGGKK